MSNIETVPTSKLVPGDIVFHHGMALRLGERHESTSHTVPGVLWFDGEVLNRDELVKRRAEEGYGGCAQFILAAISGGRGWTVQGNDLASWCRAVRA